MKKARLVQLENCLMEEYNSSEVNLLRREVNVLVEKEEVFWRQGSRVSWLKEGDRNTQFYHACASQRQKTNTILGLRDDHGVWHSAAMAINTIAVDYFHNLFTSSNLDSIDELVQSVDAVVMQDMNDSLMQPFSFEEIRRALFQISPSKALGSDGMTALSFKNIGTL